MTTNVNIGQFLFNVWELITEGTITLFEWLGSTIDIPNVGEISVLGILGGVGLVALIVISILNG